MTRNTLKNRWSINVMEAGCDEAGRGCLAGPVFAAAVIFPENPSNHLSGLLDDSKRLTARKRSELRYIIEQEAVAYGVAMVDTLMIDQVNILNASISAMHFAMERLSVAPQFIVVDGNRFKPFNHIPHVCIVQADATYLHVAAASILAKTWRDEHMMQLHATYPHYGWDKNKGYPTAMHLKALSQYGSSPHHRQTFGPVRQLRFPFT